MADVHRVSNESPSPPSHTIPQVSLDAQIHLHRIDFQVKSLYCPIVDNEQKRVKITTAVNQDEVIQYSSSEQKIKQSKRRLKSHLNQLG